MHGTEHNRGSCSIVTAFWIALFSSIPHSPPSNEDPRRRKRMLARIPGSTTQKRNLCQQQSICALIILCGQGEKRVALLWNIYEWLWS
jgi:hypothetical protein